MTPTHASGPAPHDDTPAHDDTPPDAAEAMALLTAQQKRVGSEMMGPVPWLYGVWGVAWLVGFLLLWSAWPDGNPWFTVPWAVAIPGYAILILGAIVASVVFGVRINRGVRGTSDFQGMVYGLSWSICGTAFTALGVGLIDNGLSPELASVYFPSAFGLMVGTLYLGGAALWRDRTQLVVGIALLAVASIAPFFGYPHNNLVMAVLGGGAFLAGAGASIAQLRRSRPTSATAGVGRG